MKITINFNETSALRVDRNPRVDMEDIRTLSKSESKAIKDAVDFLLEKLTSTSPLSV